MLWKTVVYSSRGAIDLASIMVGIVVMGIVGGVITATVFVAIPWAQDNAARQQLESIDLAQQSYAGIIIGSNHLNNSLSLSSNLSKSTIKEAEASYGNLEDLISKRLLKLDMKEGSRTVSADQTICVTVDQAADTYNAAVKSSSGNVFLISSETNEPSKALSGDITCLGTIKANGDIEPIPIDRFMISTWDTSLPGCNVITLPVDGTVKGTINWGDGVKEALAPLPTHTYTGIQGQKIIIINAEFSRWGVSPASGKTWSNSCITAVTKWADETNTTDVTYAFQNAKNLTKVLNLPSGVTDFSYIFNGATAFNDPSVASWNTTKITNLRSVFEGATLFNQNISSWDVSNVSDMTLAFANATNFNQPIGSWNISKVKWLGQVFTNASSFNMPLNSWNTSAVTTFQALFSGATNFNQPLDSWNTSNVVIMVQVFSGATAFNQNINSWDMSKAISTDRMFNAASTFNQPIDNWNMAKVTDMNMMFLNAVSFNQQIEVWNTGSVITMPSLFSGAIAFNQPLNNWNVSNVTNMSNMFLNATKFNQPLNNWNTIKVTNMSNMFYQNAVFNQPLNNWNVSNVTNMKSMFYGGSAFNQNINNWDTSKVTNMSYMFYLNSSFNQPLNNWKTSTVSDMSYMFARSVFNQNISNWIVNSTAVTTNFRQLAVLADANTPSKSGVKLT